MFVSPYMVLVVRGTCIFISQAEVSKSVHLLLNNSSLSRDRLFQLNQTHHILVIYPSYILGIDRVVVRALPDGEHQHNAVRDLIE